MADALEILENGYNNAIGVLASAANNISVTEAAIGAGVVGLGVGGGIVGALSSEKSFTKKRKSRKKITHTKRGWKADRARRSKQKWEVAYQKKKRKKAKMKKKSKATSRRKHHSKKIHYARKTGQPYIILSNGRARFIKGKRRKN